MADIFSIGTSPIPVRSNPVRTPQVQQPSESTAPIQPSVDSDARTRREEQLENVVAVSEDGDTLQVSDEAQEEQEAAASGSVSETERTQTTDSPIGRIAEEENFDTISEPDDDTESVQPDITNFSGYTNQQLEQLYLTGVISRYDYESEIASREEAREELEQTNTENSRVMTGINSIMQHAQRMGDALQTAFSKEASTTLSPQTRMDALENLELTPAQKTAPDADSASGNLIIN